MTTPPIDPAALGLLDGLDGEARAQRHELVAWLVEHGVPEHELLEAHASGTLVYAAASRLLSSGDRLTASELVDQAGLSLDFARRLQRAQGFAAIGETDDPIYTDADLAAMRTVALFLQVGLSEEQVLATSRVLGRGMAQAATLMREQALELALEPGASERELAEAYLNTSEGLVPLVGPMVEQLLRLHLDHAAREEIVTAAERASGSLPGAREVTVAFADLVGFTKMGEELDPTELERVAARLVDLAGDVVEPPVRMVKSVGDAVLLVCPEPQPLLEASFALLEAAELEGEEFPQLRIGVARGAAVSRAGDWFGKPVNLASRITSVARAGSVVTDQATRDTLANIVGVTWSTVGDRRMKGISGSVRLHRARPS